MNMIEAYVAFWRNYFNFRGRACRAEYWWPVLLNGLVMAAMVIGMVASADLTAPASAISTPTVPLTVLGLFGAVIWLPSITVSIRRLHDAGFSGWLYLVILVPFVGGLVVLVLTILPGQSVPNRWGPPRAMALAQGTANLHPAPERRAHPASAVAGRTCSSNPWQGYATLIDGDRPLSPEQRAAQREEVLEYYRTRVLGQTGPQAPTP